MSEVSLLKALTPEGGIRKEFYLELLLNQKQNPLQGLGYGAKKVLAKFWADEQI